MEVLLYLFHEFTKPDALIHNNDDLVVINQNDSNEHRDVKSDETSKASNQAEHASSIESELVPDPWDLTHHAWNEALINAPCSLPVQFANRCQNDEIDKSDSSPISSKDQIYNYLNSSKNLNSEQNDDNQIQKIDEVSNDENVLPTYSWSLLNVWFQQLFVSIKALVQFKLCQFVIQCGWFLLVYCKLPIEQWICKRFDYYLTGIINDRNLAYVLENLKCKPFQIYLTYVCFKFMFVRNVFKNLPN